ncbi:MAG: peroxidase [Pseudomonadota bacterium]
MAFIETIPAAAATGAALEMYQRQEEHWGYVPNYAKVFSHRPEVMARWGRLLAEIRRPVDERRFELVTFVASHEHRYSACLLTHGRKLAELIGKHRVLAIAGGREADVLPVPDVAIVRFARAIARDASRITAEQVQKLKTVHQLSDGEIFDIAAVAAGRSFFAKLLDALGSAPDVTAFEIEEDLRKPLTIGRPICTAAPETTQRSAAA